MGGLQADLLGGSGGADAPPGIKLGFVFSQPRASNFQVCSFISLDRIPQIPHPRKCLTLLPTPPGSEGGGGAHGVGGVRYFGCVEDNSLQPRSKASPDPPIKSAWRPPNMDMYSGCYIQNMDIYSGTYIYIYIHIMDITSRIYIHILDITSRKNTSFIYFDK